ncbi:hypothetical protein GGS26DRAFT_599172 [Hypomontagnella submonticulosa]|nr:hypothetical protein GGS26DRAFT_599172 [Hypomontagnella submonticulosa]
MGPTRPENEKSAQRGAAPRQPHKTPQRASGHVQKNTSSSKTASAKATPSKTAFAMAAMAASTQYQVASSQAAAHQAAAHQAAAHQALVPQAPVLQAAVPQAAVPQAAIPQAPAPQAPVPQAAVPQAAVPQAASSPAEAATPCGHVRDIHHKTAEGSVDSDGRFVCGKCGAKMTNASHNISTHLTTKHNENSMKFKKGLEDPRRCGICNRPCNSFNIFQTHVRNRHQHRGTLDPAWQAWQNSKDGDVVPVPQSTVFNNNHHKNNNNNNHNKK